MQIYEYKLRARPEQYAAIDEAIRIVQFVRNSCLRRWMDTRGTRRNDLQCLCAVLAATYPFAARLNSQARQAAADRAWSAIVRFYENCQKKKPGKKRYPRFQHDNRSVEYKQTGWQLEPDGRNLTITDESGIGQVRLVGNKKQRLEEFPLEKIRRVRLVRRADGYYAQFAVDALRRVEHAPTGKQLGIDMGLKVFLTDSDGNTVANPRHLRKAEKRLKRLHRRLSRCQKKSMNRRRARQKLARVYLKVQRQREDFARKTASTLITSSDVIAYEHLQIAHLVKNRKLAKAISDAAWGRFLAWLKYYSHVYDVPVISVEPAFTSQDCSACGQRVQKSLSVRTHVCPSCGLVVDRDHNAAINILAKACRTGGQSETGTPMRVQNASGQATATRRSARATRK